MATGKYTYLILLLLSLIGPLLLSFDRKVRYYHKWKYLFPAIIRAAVLFILWDIIFTQTAIWGFNMHYLVGLKVLHLPIEEWLFFLIIPFSCLFIYEVVQYYFPWLKIISGKVIKSAMIALFILLMLIAVRFHSHYYTFIVFLLAGAYLLLIVLFRKNVNWFSPFLLAYFIAIVPFIVVNGLLTSLPIIWYNPTDIMGISMMTMPVEDFVYFFLLLLMVTDFYQVLLARHPNK